MVAVHGPGEPSGRTIGVPARGQAHSGAPGAGSLPPRRASVNGSSASPWGTGDSASPWGSSAFAAEVVYCLVSAGTILFNKHALSTYSFPAPNLLLTFQFGIAVVLLKVLDLLGFLHLEPLQWDMVKLWFPVNIIFVFMNATGFYALMSVSAGMFTVLKNLANLLTILGDWYFFDKTYSWQVWACLGLMIISAALGGWTDLSFSASGYAWQIVNCIFTAAYSLHLSSVVRAASNAHAHAHSNGSGAGGTGKPGSDGISGREHGSGGSGRRRLSELSMVYYNNVLSVGPLFLLALIFNEPVRLNHYPFMTNPDFIVVVLMGSLLGFGVSFASIWCMSRTSATIYSLTGSMNKVVVAVVGMWYFREAASATNLLSIGLGLGAGFLFVFAKSAGAQQSSGPPLLAVGVGGSSGGGSGPNSPGAVLDEEAGTQVLTAGTGGRGELTARPGMARPPAT
ncbi:hypothetical protein HYH03_002636 [Edaphochlamys debaryana]|uniref:GDP-mannose transporter n=1 Tax=Edaphochlamys debaryana TaxID=47281 RepID=A0A835YF08_9CHLO|nr:hypothetical protein HYH03_002636 [Edaphochlamys debaryana]|eukprot:KAG2499701.1 hypothetical protein HYH03_002636 [Edaphochlamys debaryana]